MARYEDLSAYEYNSLCEPWVSAVNVGWLERGDEGRLGYEVDPGFVAALQRVVDVHRVNQARGAHRCHFCPFAEAMALSVLLGSAEAQFDGPDGTVYATPALVPHYVEAHGYLPPRSFVDAVMWMDTRLIGPGGPGVYPDLSPYEYGRRGPSETKVNVGWLGPDDEVGGPVDRDFADALHRVVFLRATHITGSVRPCPFCSAVGVLVKPVPGYGGSHTLGRVEAHFEGPDGVVYAVPDLIAHFVDPHGYRPPARFVEAVRWVDERIDRTSPPTHRRQEAR